MIHALAINRDQAWAGSAGAGNTLLRRLHGQRCQPASDHREFQSARHATSLVRRKLAGATCSGPFIRVGWAGDLNTIAALRIRKYSGLDERAATHIVEAEHSSAPGHFQCFPERNSHSSKSLSKRGQPVAGVLKDCQHGMPKNWESLPNWGSE